MLQGLHKEVADRMEKSLDALRREFSTIRTGRASLHILDAVKVEYYGSMMSLNQVASLNLPDARLIEIKPFDKSALPDIEKAILKANLGLVPQGDGKVIRINFPPLSEERRKELVKVVRKMAEEGKVSIRNIRREANDTVKEYEKEKLCSEDDAKTAEQQIQKATDLAIARVEEAVGLKEKEMMEI